MLTEQLYEGERRGKGGREGEREEGGAGAYKRLLTSSKRSSFSMPWVMLYCIVYMAGSIVVE